MAVKCAPQIRPARKDNQCLLAKVVAVNVLGSLVHLIIVDQTVDHIERWIGDSSGRCRSYFYGDSKATLAKLRERSPVPGLGAGSPARFRHHPK